MDHDHGEGPQDPAAAPSFSCGVQNGLLQLSPPLNARLARSGLQRSDRSGCEMFEHQWRVRNEALCVSACKSAIITQVHAPKEGGRGD